MNTLTYALSDSAAMLGRNLRHAWRYPSLTLSTAGMPIIFLLLFVYVFGGVMGDGIGGSGGRGEYLNYVAPGIILMTAAAGAVSTAVSVNIDMTEGIVARFRTMAIFRPSILTGHVLGSVITTMFSIVLVIAVAVLMGFRPTAGPLEWLGVVGLVAILAFALTWLAVALGLVADNPETASNLPLPIIMLPFLGSGFVPPESMPTAVRWFAEYQPFTPLTDTLRGLLMGTPIGSSALVSVAWCAAITVLGFLWARKRFNRDSSR